MPQPVFPVTVAYDHDKGSIVEEYTPSQVAGETFGYGDFVFLAANVAKLCGADPASITGLSEVVSERARLITPNGKVPIRTLNSEATLQMCSDTVPVEATHLNVAYGITRDPATGIWKLDTAKIGAAARVTVVRLLIPEGIWVVKPIASFLTNDGIAS